MRIGILSYPMLFQREGGLQVQVRSTLRALQEQSAPGLEVELVDVNRQRLDQFDLIHVFSAINGNHRLVELAADLGVPVVLSALLSPGWGRLDGLRARLADRLTGLRGPTGFDGHLHLRQRSPERLPTRWSMLPSTARSATRCFRSATEITR